MLTLLVTIILQAFAIGLTVALIWGVPTYFIYREQHIPEQEKRLWIIANVFFPWVAFFVFMLVAPVTKKSLN